MKRKFCMIAAVLSAFFMLPIFNVAAYAGGGDSSFCEGQPQQQQIVDITPRTETPDAVITVTNNTEPDNAEANTPAEETAPIKESPAPELPAREPGSTDKNPFTPSGTGEVTDNATENDGKEFFTITTPDENTFYLVIDRQRTGENVYLLNAVTEADLLSLAKTPPVSVPVPVEPTPTPAEPEPEVTPEKSGGAGMMIVVVIVVLVGGGAGYYFKIYRPKQEQADSSEDYEADEFDPYGGDEQDAEPDYGNTDWDSGYDEPEVGHLPDEDGEKE